MATDNDDSGILLPVVALGGLGLLAGRTVMDGDGSDDGTDGGDGGQTTTCSQEVSAAQDYADAAQACASETATLTCPHSDLTYQAVNGCEINYLVSKGWAVVEPDQDPDDSTDPEPATYQFRILSASTVGVDYRLHVGANPTLLDSPEVDSRYKAESGGNDTVTQLADGTWLIEGMTGSSDGSTYGDTFRWTTTQHSTYGVLGWEASMGTDDYSLTVDGQEIDPHSLPTITV